MDIVFVTVVHPTVLVGRHAVQPRVMVESITIKPQDPVERNAVQLRILAKRKEHSHPLMTIRLLRRKQGLREAHLEVLVL